MASSTADLKVLSLNVWGVCIALNRQNRMTAVGRAIKDYDIVCLQEQFEETDWQLILQADAGAHPHSIRFPSGFMGSGLAVLSKHPIHHHAFQAYDVQGFPENVHHGDYYANKGVCMCQIRVPAANGSTETLFVYNTHTHAQYQKLARIGGYANERYAAVRTAQTLQLAQYIVTTSQSPIDPQRMTPCNRVLLCGDMNASPDSPELRLLKAYCFKKAGLRLQRAIPTTAENMTFCYENGFIGSSTGYFNVLDMLEDLPIQLDHIIFSTPGVELVREGRAVLKDNNHVPHGKKATPISDHYGVEATVRCCDYSTRAAVYGQNSGLQEEYEAKGDEHIAESTKILRLGVAQHDRHRRNFNAAMWCLIGLGVGVGAVSNRHRYLRATVSAFCGFTAALCFVLSKVNRRCGVFLLKRLAQELEEVSVRPADC